MGNYLSRRTCAIAGKIILSDGTVHEFDRPMVVAELMLEHPQHFVFELGSLVSGHRPIPLPADQKLDLEKAYLMSPMKRGKAALLKADEIRRIMAKARSVVRPESISGHGRILPMFGLMCPAGGVVEGQEIVSKRKDCLVEKEESKVPEKPPEDFDALPEYFSRQFSGKGWKPTLDTIEEKGIEKVPHWLF
ncbi:hypothetical protein MRB53_031869 [Persea americana]|uniref:Uncharacterized protein n=1 Tax=Persea americana TaxID=3435 RepID=A0ACC2KQ99_PERAE|nr:hypothetical protein MRB53_031869 [Persea americana]